MSFGKLVNSLFKEDPIERQLRRIGVLSDALVEEVIINGLVLFQQYCQMNQQEKFLKQLIWHLEEKATAVKRLKILMLLLEISKKSKYDVADIIMNKRIKGFLKSIQHNSEDDPAEGLQRFLEEEIILEVYDYLLKLASNEELYTTCKSGQVPRDDIFRRGNKIRFIWVFKVYNLIRPLIPVLSAIRRCLSVFPNCRFLRECAKYLYQDMLFMNDFIVGALEEAAADNYLLMPYFDLLQFQESLKEQLATLPLVQNLYEMLSKHIEKLNPPKALTLSEEDYADIELHALRVALISNTLKNPKKDHTRLETEYNSKFQSFGKKYVTESDCLDNQTDIEGYKQKFKNLQ